MGVTMEIPTEHGDAVLWWDATNDPSNPGWVLTYHLEPPGSDHAFGRRDLIDPLDTDAGPDDIDDAHRVALAYLGRQRVGAGRQLSSRDAATVGGVAHGTWRHYRHRPRPLAPEPDGHEVTTGYPWWWESTVIHWSQTRPGRGARTDMTGTPAEENNAQ